MINKDLYSKQWFSKQKTGAYASAEVIVPIIIDMVNPKSVVDVGCGLGVWLDVFRKNGVKDILGIDGNWVQKSELVIPEGSFRTENINESFEVGRKSDLAICLEVGEHLPEERAKSLVESLTKTANVVAFSAAIPQQPGTGHVNCQWPQYWADIFGQLGFKPVDCIRRRVWLNPKVEYWYAQNILLYVKETELTKYPKIYREVENGFSNALPLVHPTRYYYALKPPPSFAYRVIRKLKLLSKQIQRV